MKKQITYFQHRIALYIQIQVQIQIQICRYVDIQIYRYVDMQTYIHIDIQTYRYIDISPLKKGRQEHSEVILDQSKTKIQLGKLQTASLWLISKNSSDLQFFPSVLTTTHLSLRLDPFPVTSSPWQVFHGSGIITIVGSPRLSRLHLHIFTQ